MEELTVFKDASEFKVYLNCLIEGGRLGRKIAKKTGLPISKLKFEFLEPREETKKEKWGKLENYIKQISGFPEIWYETTKGLFFPADSVYIEGLNDKGTQLFTGLGSLLKDYSIEITPEEIFVNKFTTGYAWASNVYLVTRKYRNEKICVDLAQRKIYFGS
jgi:hypothetical protein